MEKRGARLKGYLSVQEIASKWDVSVRWIPCIILAVVWIAHILYFGLRVKTIHKQIQHENDERQLRAVSIDGG